MSTFKTTLLSSLLLLCFLILRTAPAGVAAPSPSCDQTNQRTISLRVNDKAGAPIDNLRLEDLSLSENKATRELLSLEHKANEPLSIAILIDTSASQERTLAGTKLAAQKFIESILRSDKDRAAVVSFTGEATIEQELTNDLTALQAAVNRVKFVRPPGFLTGGVVLGPPPSGNAAAAGSTAIWDAVWATVDGINPAAASRRVIVLLTDGEDTSSKTKMREAIEHAAIHDVVIFSIGIADHNYGDVDRESLKKLSEGTGGRAFFAKKLADLDAIFSTTIPELQSQYALSYCAANQKPSVKPLKIEIEIKNPQLRQGNVQLSYPHYGL